MREYQIGQNKVIPLRIAKKLILILVIIIAFDFFLFPAPTYASASDEEQLITEENNSQIILADIATFNNSLPENNDLKIKNTSYRKITAYNSEVGQCDASPCITANGFNLCEYGIEDSIAANFLPFGAKVRFPDLFPDKVFIVRDRMSEQYSDRIDIWMKNKNDAKEFGIKTVKVEILE